MVVPAIAQQVFPEVCGRSCNAAKQSPRFSGRPLRPSKTPFRKRAGALAMPSRRGAGFREGSCNAARDVSELLRRGLHPRIGRIQPATASQARMQFGPRLSRRKGCDNVRSFAPSLRALPRLGILGALHDGMGTTRCSHRARQPGSHELAMLVMAPSRRDGDALPCRDSGSVVNSLAFSQSTSGGFSH